jgi:tetratricopeptide (TPR) repeat protein/flagellar motor protein MotB
VLRRSVHVYQDCLDTSYGDSQVFGPSNLCFSALSYLITAGQNFRNIFHSIAEMFQEVTTFLQRFAVYVEKFSNLDLDPAMKSILHELLTSFVRICTLSVRVLNENKVLLYLKVFTFASDEGVSGELARLRSLVAKEAAMRGTLTFGSVMKSERDIAVGFSDTKEGIAALGSAMEKITKGEEEKRKDAIGNQQRETIKKALRDPADSSYRDILIRHSIGFARQTGGWLKDNSKFTAWAGTETTEHPILCISGAEGYGKSYLVASIIRYLRKRYPQGSQDPARTSVAYYFFQEDKELQSLNNALRALVWQIVLNDVAYQKDAAAVCKDPDNLSTNDDLWDRLFADFMDTAATFFIVLDGIDRINSEERRSFLRILKSATSKTEQQRQLRFRFLIAGRPKSLQEIEVDSMSIINLRTENHEDIMTFVAEKVEDIEVLKGDSDQMQTLRQKVFEAVTTGADGDFVKTGMTLEEISTKDKPSEIEKVLEHAGEPRAEVIKKQIKRLQNELKETEIQDLNVLLAWVTQARRSLTISELDMILYRRNGERSFNFEQKLRDRYSVLFRISEKNEVDLVSSSIIEHFAEKITPIVPAEINIVKRFLKSVCDDDLYERFGFEAFFSQRLERPATTINVDPNDAEVQIIKGCLDSMFATERGKIETLVEYAREFLPEHLASVDLSAPGLSSEDKSKIGTQLLDAFWKDDIIERWWPIGSFDKLDRDTWLFDEDDANVQAVLAWFRNSTVIKNIDADGLAWIKTLTSNLQPDADLLLPITKLAARRWLQGRTSEIFPPFTWVRGFVTKVVLWLTTIFCLLTSLIQIQSRKGSGKRWVRHLELGSPTKSDIDLVVNWATNELQIKEQDSLWRSNVAEIFIRYEIWDAAAENIRIALELDNTNWAAYEGLAHIYGMQERYDLAVETLTHPVQAFREDETLRAEEQFLYYSMCEQLGSCYEKMSQYDKAISLYQEVLNRDPEAWGLTLSLIMALKAQGKYHDIMKFIKELNDYRDVQFGGSRLTKWLHYFAYEKRCHDVLLHAASVTDNLPLVMKAYRSAIDKAKTGSNVEEDPDLGLAYVVNHLSFQYGIALLYYGAEGTDREAVELWEQNLRDTNGKTGMETEIIRFANRKWLCRVYLHNAKTAGWDTAVAKSNIDKLAQLSTDIYCGQFLSFVDIDPKLMLGRYFHLIQQQNEAMASVRAHIKIALDLLSDDDPTNDWQGYLKLATVLTYLDDDTNAQAAWSLIRPDDQPVAERVGTVTSCGPLEKTCSGSCGHSWEFADAMYVCRDCLDVQFDKKCWELLTTQKAILNVCHHAHKFLYVPEWKADEQGKVEPGMVKVGDNIVPIEEWLAGIRATWGLAGPGMVYGVVQHDFKAEKPDELAAKAGEKITIVAQSSPEWFVAKPLGREGGPGLIPVSFIEVRDVTTDMTVADPREAVRKAGVPRLDELKDYGLMSSILPKT